MLSYGAIRKLSEIDGKPLLFLQWSAWRTVLGARHLTKHSQVADGREEALANMRILGGS